MLSAPALAAMQNSASLQEGLPFYITSNIQVPPSIHEVQHHIRSLHHSASTMVERSPILPIANDGHGSFALVHESCDDMVPGQQSDTVLGLGVLTAEPVGETASSKCSSIVLHDDVYIAAAPVAFISNLRYKRRECLDYDKIPSYGKIGPRNSDVQARQLPADCKWVPHVHPEGSVYFQQENWFTNVWLYDPQNLRDIDAALHLVSQELRRQRMPSSRYEICLDIDTEVDDETKETVKLGCYYMWDKDAEEVFWLQETVSSFFYDGLDVKILGREHLRHAGEMGYWGHIYMFPHGRSLTIEQLHVLRADIAYYLFDKKISKSSTAPYNKDDLNDLLDILKEIGASMKDDLNFGLQGVAAVARPQYVVIVSRLKETLCRERFMRLHGERYAQLDSDRSVYENGHRERSLIFTVLTWMFFFTPPIYFEQISSIWVDRKINYDRWRGFIGNLQDDWMASITPSAVILSANVGFLAIQSVDGGGAFTPNRSMGQLVSYMSTLFSIGNILACTTLAWQHRPSKHHHAEDAVKYLVARASSRSGIERLALIFSIPITLFLLALLTFFIAISWECFHTTNTITRVITVIAMFIIAILLFGIIHNSEWQSEQNTNSLASSMARMRKLVNEGRLHAAKRWTAFSGTLVAWPTTVFQKRKSAKKSSRLSGTSPRNSMEMSQVSLSITHLPQIGEVTQEITNACEEGSPAAAPPGLSPARS